jgi:hypothetical protein
MQAGWSGACILCYHSRSDSYSVCSRGCIHQGSGRLVHLFTLTILSQAVEKTPSMHAKVRRRLNRLRGTGAEVTI